jgi:hypothetical protein
MRVIQLKIISLKLLFICFMIGFGIFFAMDVANNGFSKPTITDPQDTDMQPSPTVKPKTLKTAIEQENTSDLGPVTAATARLKAAEAQRKQAAAAQDEQPAPTIVVQDSFVNRLTNKIGDVLRHLATAMIDTIVTLFKIILG